MRILVLGSRSSVGKSLVPHLVAAGDTLRTYDRTRAELDGIESFEGPLTDPNRIADAADGCDAIIVSVGLADGQPAEAYRWLHEAGTENILAAARDRGVPRVVLVSCGDVVLADEDRVHWDERRELTRPPVGPRARALKLGEELALAQSDTRTSVVALRPGWLWGPHERRLAMLRHEAKHGGIDLCGDGKNLIATTHLTNLVLALDAVVRSSAGAGQAFYVSDAEFLEFGEFVTLWSKTLELPPPRAGLLPRWTRVLRARAGLEPLGLEEVLRRSRSTLFDTQKLTEVFGIRPAIDVDTGLTALRAAHLDT